MFTFHNGFRQMLSILPVTNGAVLAATYKGDRYKHFCAALYQETVSTSSQFATSRFLFHAILLYNMRVPGYLFLT